MERGPVSIEMATDQDGDSFGCFRFIHLHSFLFCKWNDSRLDTLNDELCQVNTRVGRIAQRQAVMGDFTASSSPSPQASKDESDDDCSGSDDADVDDGTSSSDDKEMIASQWLTLCHSWQKGEVVFGIRVVMYLGGELV